MWGFLLFLFIYTIYADDGNLDGSLQNNLETLKVSLKNVLRSIVLALDLEIDAFAQKIKDVESGSLSVIEKHIQATSQSSEMFFNAISEIRNISSCLDDLRIITGALYDKSVVKIRKVGSKALGKSQGVFVTAVAVLNKLQNKSAEIGSGVGNCLEVRSDECMEELLQEMEIMQGSLPAIGQSLINRFELGMKLFEAEIIVQIQRILNSMILICSEAFLGFIVCILD